MPEKDARTGNVSSGTANGWRAVCTETDARGEGGEGLLLRDYVEGTTVEELIGREGPLDAADTAEIGIRICRKVAAFHRQTPPVIPR